MPTITSLLRRKKASNPKGSEESEFVLETNQLRTNVTQALPSDPSQMSKIQPASRRSKGAPKQRIPSWKLEEIQGTGDAHSQAAWALVENGAMAILHLRCAESAPEASIWQSVRAWGPRELRSLWSGFSWDPTPQRGLWATLSNTGFYEISPSLKGDWSSMRRLFGAQPTDYLSLFKISSDECLVVIGPKSINAFSKTVLSIFAQASKTPAA